MKNVEIQDMTTEDEVPMVFTKTMAEHTEDRK
jgi:hypothetical protein